MDHMRTLHASNCIQRCDYAQDQELKFHQSELDYHLRYLKISYEEFEYHLKKSQEVVSVIKDLNKRITK